MRKVCKSLFLFFTLLLAQCTNSSPTGIEDFNEPEEPKIEEKKIYTFENLFNYNDVDKVWNSDKTDHTIVYSTSNDSYGQVLKEYDYLVDNFEHSNEKTKIGNFDYISIYPFSNHIPGGIVSYRKIYVTDVQFGESLIRFSDKNNYEVMQQENNEKRKTYVAEIDFNGNIFDLYDSGYFSFEENNTIYISKQSTNPIEIVNYAILNHSVYSKDSYSNIFDGVLFPYENSVVTFIKKDKKVVVTKDEMLKKKNEYFVNFSQKENLFNELYFTNDYKKIFVDGEAIIVQSGIVDENNKVTCENSINYIPFIDKNGTYYWYQNLISMHNYDSYERYSFAYDSPSLRVERTVFNYSFINSLFE